MDGCVERQRKHRFIFSASFLQIADVRIAEGTKVQVSAEDTYNERVSKAKKNRLLRGCLIGFGMRGMRTSAFRVRYIVRAREGDSCLKRTGINELTFSL